MGNYLCALAQLRFGTSPENHLIGFVFTANTRGFDGLFFRPLEFEKEAELLTSEMLEKACFIYL